MALLLLEKTETIKMLSPEASESVRTLFAESYNLQIRILIGFAVAKIPVTALMWTNVKSDA
jgi:uncharacterized protein YdhG (YjbR/CyaY superfamily)